MLISKRAADPHANGMVTFFSDLLYMRVKKKKLSLIITSILNEQRYLAHRHMKGPCPTTPAAPRLQYAHQST